MQSTASIQKGLGRVTANEAVLRAELDSHYELLAEPVQTVMRKYDIANPYEVLKDFTRGKATVSADEHVEFIDRLEGLPPAEQKRLRELKPSTYTGYASEMAKNLSKYK